MTRPVRIANCSGFYGDRLAAAREMLDQGSGPIDVLTGDYLAELTMLILWKARRKDPALGYATTFLKQMEDVLGQKAEHAITLLTGLLGGTEQFGEFDVRLLRFDHPDAPTNEQATAHLRVTVKDQDEHKVGRAFSNAAMELALAGYAGFHTTSPPTAASAFGLYWPTLVPAALVTQTVHLPDGRTEIVRHHESPYHAPARPRSVADTEPVGPGGPLLDVPLGRLCGARSGDKGGAANVGLWATSPRVYAWLREYLTAGRLTELLPEAVDLQIDRYELPNLLALNFVIHGLLAPRLRHLAAADGERRVRPAGHARSDRHGRM